MGRKYTIKFEDLARDAAFDCFEIVVPADAVMYLHEVRITQTSDAGDSESEQLKYSIKRASGSYTSGSGGSSFTPTKMESGDAAAGITAEIGNTTQASAGTGALEVLLPEAENIHSGWFHSPPPNRMYVFSPSQACIISMESTPADSITFSGYAIVEEVGG